MNNGKFCTLSYMLHHEAGQDRVSALSEFYSFFPFFPKRKPTFKPSFLLFLCVHLWILSEMFGESVGKSEDFIKEGELILCF